MIQAGLLIVQTQYGHASQKTRHVIATHCSGVTSLRIGKLNGHKENTAAVLVAMLRALPGNGFTCQYFQIMY
jgi:hypothetical protein